ncbi:MAG: histidinol-phosphate transaminase [Acidobacteriota bacterium]|nr:histidinol-phosphate transaminase [Acidobacteriota bacterium]
MAFKLENLVRENIKRLTPYSSARKEYSGAAQIYLDANENSFGSPLAVDYSRYPDPLQTKIKSKIAAMNDMKSSEVFIGSGSDEAIDLLFRIFCEPRRDSVLICPPTYGMYQVSAEINDVAVVKINLTSDFRLDSAAIEAAFELHPKLLFVCSPNNPTGNAFPREEILRLAGNFAGIIVTDEAYVHFSTEKSLVSEINRFKNLVVLQTFSKAWGLAGLRVGLAFADAEIIALFNRVKPPYNVSQIAQTAILEALENVGTVKKNIAEIIAEREKLMANLSAISLVEKVYPTDANFVLVKMTNAEKIYRNLLDEKIVVRNRSSVELCADCLRITVGTPDENKSLLKSLKNLTT